MRVMRTHRKDPQGRGMQPGRDAFQLRFSLLLSPLECRPAGAAIRYCPLPGIAMFDR
jgi:hypothetical protein